jgi:hypothetical protein
MELGALIQRFATNLADICIMLSCCDSDYVISILLRTMSYLKDAGATIVIPIQSEWSGFSEYQGYYFEMRNIAFLSSAKVSFFLCFDLTIRTKCRDIGTP